jgi:transcriptional regulator with XRE-family HTH domain
MSMIDLERLGQNIAKLRVAKKLKQSELAYEAGVSERTLQRIEAGEVVKTDGLLKIVRQLGRIEEFLSAVATASFSPNQLARQIKGAASKDAELAGAFPGPAKLPGSRKTRVRKSGKNKRVVGSVPKTIVWPEDQE